MLTTPADYWFSRCVRERVNWTCENCGKQYHEGDHGLHCSHFFGRGNWSVRLEPLNAFSHCFSCHLRFEGNPFLFVGWAEKQLKENYPVLVELSNDIMRGKLARRTKGRGVIATHYKSEFERMQAERRAGKTGRIEFVGWY